MINKLITQYLFQKVREQLYEAIQLSNELLNPLEEKDNTEIEFTIDKKGRCRLIVVDNNVDKVIVQEKGGEIYLSQLLMNHDDLELKCFSKDYMLNFFASVISRVETELMGTFWEQPNGMLTLMVTSKLNKWSIGVEPGYIRNKLAEMNEETKGEIVKGIGIGIDRLLDEESVYRDGILDEDEDEEDEEDEENLKK